MIVLLITFWKRNSAPSPWAMRIFSCITGGSISPSPGMTMAWCPSLLFQLCDVAALGLQPCSPSLDFMTGRGLDRSFVITCCYCYRCCQAKEMCPGNGQADLGLVVDVENWSCFPVKLCYQPPNCCHFFQYIEVFINKLTVGPFPFNMQLYESLISLDSVSSCFVPPLIIYAPEIFFLKSDFVGPLCKLL